jgi:isobutyryl-CoA dehydrogenase
MKHWDESSTFPIDTMKKAASLGFGGLYCSPTHGGTDMTRLQSSLVFDALSTGCVSTTAYISIHNVNNKPSRRMQFFMLFQWIVMDL